MKKSIFLFFAAILCAMSVSAKTVYLKAGQWTDGGAKFGCHTWGSSNKSGFMTHVEGDVYKFETLDANTNVIFTRVASGATGIWDQEWDRVETTFQSGKDMFVITDWKAGKWDVYTPIVTHTFAKNTTIYLDFRALTKKGADIPQAGTAATVYNGNAGGTVIPLTFTADVKWAEGTKFLKTEQSGWSNDIPFVAPKSGENCAQVAADGKSYTWTTYSEPSVTLSLDKESADAGTEVTVTLTATADNVAGEVTYAFQYSTDNATWNNISSTGNTATQTFAAETRYYKVTMTNGGNTKEATAKFSAIVFHVIGSWDDWTTHNVTVDGNVTLTLEAGKTYEYKITDGSWDNHWGNDGTMNRENCTGWSFESGNNAKITTDEAGDYVFNVTRNNEGKVKVSVAYPELVTPIPTYDYYIAGSFNSNNPKNAENGMTLDSDVYKATVTLAEGDNTLKVTDGTWENTWGANELGAAYEEVSNPNDYNNIKITLAAEAEKNITVIFNAATGKITFEGLTPYVAPLTYTVTVPAGTEKCYIAGAFAQSNWNTFVEMTKVGDEDKFTIEIAGAKETDEYKYACQASWDYAEVIEGGGNRTQWTALDNVTAWNKPVVYTYYLMGVNDDWATGIEMEVNTGVENEVMLTCQPVNGEVKIKRLGDDASEYWYGGKSLKEEAGNLGTNTGTGDEDGNILLEEGIYNFYFNTADGKLWIAAATDCVTEIRTGLTAGNYYTICMPKAMTNVQGATLWSFCGKDANFAYLVQEDAPYTTAGKAYIMYAEAETVSAILTGKPAPAPVANGAIHGTFADMYQDDLNAAGDNIYLVIGNQLRCVDGQTGNELPANRAYVDIDEITGGAPAGIPVNRVRSMPMQPQVATGMENVDASAQPVKTIINGQLFILRGEKMYDAQGKLVK